MERAVLKKRGGGGMKFKSLIFIFSIKKRGGETEREIELILAKTPLIIEFSSPFHFCPFLES
jgi:hypothetical protein